jgi:L-threonylcarbamoyladenylate synthase
MRTEQLKIDAQHPEPQLIARAADVLTQGGLVAFPTETVYGLGANAMQASALARIYSAKQRPATDPIIAHIHDTAQLQSLAVDIPPIAYALAAHFWPGALTLILKRAPGVPQAIAKGMDTVAVRMPAHPVAAALLKAANTPIGAPSANTFTRPSATTAAHVLEDLDGRIDMVLDGGPTQIGLESTVLDLTSAVPTILRPGGVLADDLRKLIPQLNVSTRYLDEDAVSVAPGQMLKHYSPRARVMLFSGANASSVQEQMRLTAQTLMHSGQQVGALLTDEDIEGFATGTVAAALGSRHDLPAISRRLFAALRELDSSGVDVILVNDPGREGLGAALWDRLVRAAEGEVINVLR